VNPIVLTNMRVTKKTYWQMGYFTRTRLDVTLFITGKPDGELKLLACIE